MVSNRRYVAALEIDKVRWVNESSLEFITLYKGETIIMSRNLFLLMCKVNMRPHNRSSWKLAQIYNLNCWISSNDSVNQVESRCNSINNLLKSRIATMCHYAGEFRCYINFCFDVLKCYYHWIAFFSFILFFFYSLNLFLLWPSKPALFPGAYIYIYINYMSHGVFLLISFFSLFLFTPRWNLQMVKRNCLSWAQMLFMSWDTI